MQNKARAMTISLLVSVPLYFWIEYEMPNLTPDRMYMGAAGLGFVVGVVINYFWDILSRRGNNS